MTERIKYFKKVGVHFDRDFVLNFEGKFNKKYCNSDWYIAHVKDMQNHHDLIL